MKSRSFLSIALLLSLTLAGGQQIFAQKTDKTALRQELTKLKDFLGKYGTIINANNPRIAYRLKPLNFKGCEIKFAYQEFDNTDLRSVGIFVAQRDNIARYYPTYVDPFLSPTYRSVVNLDLSKLDPASIKLNAEKIEFSSLDSQKAVKQTVGRDTKKLNESWIPLVSTKDNDEVLSLFTNVTRQCQTS